MIGGYLNNLISLKVNVNTFTPFLIGHICQIDSFAKVIKIIMLLINIIRIAVPIMLIISIMLKLVKVVGGTGDEFEKVKKVIVTNAIAAVLIFLIPTFINIITRLTGTYEAYQVCLKSSNNPITPIYVPPGDDDTGSSDGAPVITSINHKASFVTVKAKKGSKGNIAGYFFATSNKKPTGKEDNWVLKNTNTLEIAKIPGTYYVYVKDTGNNISEAKKLTITWEELYNDGTRSRDDKTFPPIVGKLSEVLSSKNDSLSNLNDFIAWSVRSAGLFTKEGVATAGISAQSYLHAKYNIHVSYVCNIHCYGQRYNVQFGADPNWGEVITLGHIDRDYRDEASSKGIKTFCKGLYGGQDCQSFFGWSLHNAGFKAENTHGSYVGSKGAVEVNCGKNCSKEKMIELHNQLVIGDEIINSSHVMLVMAGYDDNHDGIRDGLYTYEAATRTGMKKWSNDELYRSQYFTINKMAGFYEKQSNYACLQDNKGNMINLPDAWKDKAQLFRNNCKATN